MPEDPAGGELLRELLEDKRTLTTERVFMILGLLYPNEDFQGILVSFGSPLSGDRASAQELIESLLPRDTANAVIGLASEGEPATRLALADPRRKESLEGYAETVRALLKHESRSVRALALYHAGEICLDCAAEDLPGGGGGESKASGQATTLQDRAIGLLRNLSEGPARRARPLLTSILAR